MYKILPLFILVAIAFAHSKGDESYVATPQLLAGRRVKAVLRSRHALQRHIQPEPFGLIKHDEERSLQHVERGNVNGRCGVQYGSCALGVCCSPSG